MIPVLTVYLGMPPRAPSPQVLTAATHHTHAFDLDVMLDTIRPGLLVVDCTDYRRGALKVYMPAPEISVAAWLMLVPPRYRVRAMCGAYIVGQRFMGWQLTDETVRQYVRELRHWLACHLEP